MKWRIRDLFNPVITRTLLYGANPFDLEYILQQMDNIKVMSGKQIKGVWLKEWEKKADRYLEYAKKSEERGNLISAREYYKLVSQCYYACYMINSDDIELKRSIYNKLEESYRKTVSFRTNRVEYLEIPMEEGKIPAYLHFPDDGKSGKPYPCVTTYSGIGSCKEELDILVPTLLERGLAVLTVDMPGTGAALFDYDLKCIGFQLDAAFDAIAAYLESRDDIDSERMANYGLCMGGGYAFRASAKRENTKCCVSLFPLFLNFSDMENIPLWMKRGKWAVFQYGEYDNYLDRMKNIEEGTISCDFLMVHSAYDNWMDTEASMKLYDRASGYKEQIEVKEKPAFVSEETIMHAMPVGEQFHWVKHYASDFIAERLKEK
ncbi:MAG: alpha/beta hydrolase [Oscillospiraceae bacterium]